MKEYIERKALLNEVESTPWYHISYQRNLVQGAVCEAINCHKYCLHCGAKMDKQSLFEEIKTGLEQAIEYEKHNVKMDKENKNENLGR